LDLRAVVGEGTFAVGDGKVAFAGTTKDFGKLVVYQFTYRYTVSNLLSDILHGKSANEIGNKIAKDGKEYYSWHAHLSGIEKGIGAGSPVTEGQLIGHTGKSGNAANIPASERHLHFEMTSQYPPVGKSRQLGGRVDPAQFFQDLNVNPKDNRRRTP
jgi:murein DD-endopeptidase MepM/ murein hydrolase activator NlpD